MLSNNRRDTSAGSPSSAVVESSAGSVSGVKSDGALLRAMICIAIILPSDEGVPGAGLGAELPSAGCLTRIPPMENSIGRCLCLAAFTGGAWLFARNDHLACTCGMHHHAVPCRLVACWPQLQRPFTFTMGKLAGEAHQVCTSQASTTC